MATQKQILEKQDRERDAAFNKAMHGDSATAQGGVRAMLAKGGDAQKAAVDEYFKHWDNQAAKDETEETRAVSQSFRPCSGYACRPCCRCCCGLRLSFGPSFALSWLTRTPRPETHR